MANKIFRDCLHFKSNGFLYIILESNDEYILEISGINLQNLLESFLDNSTPSPEIEDILKFITESISAKNATVETLQKLDGEIKLRSLELDFVEHEIKAYAKNPASTVPCPGTLGGFQDGPTLADDLTCLEEAPDP